MINDYGEMKQNSEQKIILYQIKNFKINQSNTRWKQTEVNCVRSISRRKHLNTETVLNPSSLVSTVLPRLDSEHMNCPGIHLIETFAWYWLCCWGQNAIQSKEYAGVCDQHMLNAGLECSQHFDTRWHQIQCTKAVKSSQR